MQVSLSLGGKLSTEEDMKTPVILIPRIRMQYDLEQITILIYIASLETVGGLWKPLRPPHRPVRGPISIVRTANNFTAISLSFSIN